MQATETMTDPAVERAATKTKWIGFSTALVALALVLGGLHGEMFTQPDADAYLQMAAGEGAQVPQPYTSRQLGPLMVRGLSAATHADLNAAYVVEGVAALLLLAAMLGVLLQRAEVPAVLLAAVGGMAFWSALFNGLVLPDLLFSALLTVFLWLLYKERYLLAGAMMLPLTLARESSVLVLVCLLLVAWKRMSTGAILTALAATVAGMAAVKMLTAGGMSNRDQLNPLLYMVGKVMWNFPYNVLGVQMWSNVSNNNACAVPQWHILVHLGGIREIGTCGFNPARILCTLRTGLTCFGLLPLGWLYLIRRRGESPRADGALLRFCLLYGGIAFFLAPELGPSLPRLFGYAWPLFAIGVPMLLRAVQLKPNAAWILLGMHLAVSWAFWFIGYKAQDLELEILYFLALLAAYGSGWMLLRRHTERPLLHAQPVLR